jgi:hypothetical protein
MTVNTYETKKEPVQFDPQLTPPARYPFSFKLDHKWTVSAERAKGVPERCGASKCNVCGSRGLE